MAVLLFFNGFQRLWYHRCPYNSIPPKEEEWLLWTPH
jgi:hypothetical protein